MQKAKPSVFDLIAVLAALLSAAGCIVMSQTVRDAVIFGMKFAFLKAIPTVFVFCVIGKIIVSRGILQILPDKIFPFAVYALGLLTGNPALSVSVNDLYLSKQINKSFFQFLTACCGGPGIAFIWVFANCFEKVKRIEFTAFFIVSGILNMLFVKFFFFSKEQRAAFKTEKTNFSDSQRVPLPKIISQSAVSMVKLTGQIAFFSVIIFISREIFSLPSVLRTILTGLTEFSSGLFEAQKILTVKLRAVISALIIGFSGICCAFQVFSVSPEISKVKYLSAKIMHGLLYALLCALFI